MPHSPTGLEPRLVLCSLGFPGTLAFGSSVNNASSRSYAGGTGLGESGFPGIYLLGNLVNRGSPYLALSLTIWQPNFLSQLVHLPYIQTSLYLSRS
jgi:hypothetical protein